MGQIHYYLKFLMLARHNFIFHFDALFYIEAFELKCKIHG